MKFSITGQEKGDLLIQVIVWAGLTILVISANDRTKNNVLKYRKFIVTISYNSWRLFYFEIIFSKWCINQ